MGSLPQVKIGQRLGPVVAAAPMRGSAAANPEMDYAERANALISKISISNNIAAMSSKFVGGGVLGAGTEIATRSASQAVQMAALTAVVGAALPAALPAAIAAYSSYKTMKFALSKYSEGKNAFKEFKNGAAHVKAASPEKSFGQCLVQSIKENPVLAVSAVTSVVLSFAKDGGGSEAAADGGSTPEIATKLASGFQSKLKDMSVFFANNSTAKVLSAAGLAGLTALATQKRSDPAPIRPAPAAPKQTAPTNFSAPSMKMQ